MSIVEELLEELNSPGVPVETCLTNITLIEDQLRLISGTDLSLAKSKILSLLVPSLKFVSKSSEFISYVVSGAGVVENFAIDNQTSLSSALEIKNLGLQLFAGSDYSKVRLAGLSLLQKLFSDETNLVALEDAAEVLNVEAILVKHLFTFLGKSSKVGGNLARSVNKTLGCLCETFPLKLEAYAGKIKQTLITQLHDQTTSAVSKLDLLWVQGCFEGLCGCLKVFGLTNEETNLKKTLYEDLKKVCVKPGNEQIMRRKSMRAALELFATHAHLFSNFILEEMECRYWFDTLRSWSQSFNSEDHKIGYRCLNSFLKVIGCTFRKETTDKYKSTFAYLLTIFTNILRSKTSTSKDATLAIQGYSSLAAACKTHMGEEQVSIMLMEMINKTEEVFFSSNIITSTDNIVTHLPSYVEALSNIIEEVRKPVAPDMVAPLQRVFVHLVKQFPKLPIQYHVFAIRAFSKFFDVTTIEGVFPETGDDVVKDLIHQCLLETCSHPVVTESDNILESNLDAVTSTKTYFPIWDELIKRDLVCQYIYQSVIQILEKLDFSTDAVSAEKDFHEDIDIEKDSILASSEISQAVASNDHESTKENHQSTLIVKRPTKIKDFTVLENVVELMSRCLQKFGDQNISSWFFKFTFAIIKKATMFPDVSSLYSLLSLSLKSAPTEYFDSHDDERVLTLRFLEDVAVVCSCSQIDLLKARLHLILDLPISFVKYLMGHLTLPLKKIFSATLPLALVEKGVDALTLWNENSESGITDNIIEGVLPCLKHYMNETRTEMLEDITFLEKSKPNKKSTEVRRPENETDYERVQKKMLLFIGSIEGRLQRCLLPTADDIGRLAIATNYQRLLKLNIPFPDVRAEIFLENLLSRIVYLCLNSKQRKTRVAACECLHVISIFAIGQSATQATYLTGRRSLGGTYKVLFPALLRLASDEDMVIRDLFDPLLIQVVHWFTRHGKYENEETIILLESIFDGLCDEEDPKLRISASKYFLEFFSWSIKQTPKDLPIESIQHSKSVLKRIQGMWVHPDQNRRRGASLAFNSIYKQFREERELVEHFSLDLIIHCILSLSKGSSDGALDVINEAKLCADHLVRILQEKRKVFLDPNKARRAPKELLSSSLNDLVKWLLNWISRAECEARHKAMEILYKIASRDILHSAFKDVLLDNNQGDIGNYLTYVESCNFVGSKGIYGNHGPKLENHLEVTTWINYLIAVTECYKWLIDMDLVQIDQICERVDFVKSLLHFSNVLQHQVLNELPFFGANCCNSTVVTPKVISMVNYHVCTMVIRFLDFILVTKLNNNAANKFINQSVISVLFFSTLVPARVGFDLAKEEVYKELQSRIAKIYLALKRSFSDLLSSWFSQIPQFLHPSKVILSIWSQNNLLEAQLYLRGFKFLDDKRIIEIDEFIPSVEEFFERVSGRVSCSPMASAVFVELLEIILNKRIDYDISSLLIRNEHPDFEKIILQQFLKSSNPDFSSVDENFKSKATMRSSFFLSIKLAKACLQSGCDRSFNLFEVISSNWDFIASAATESKENFLLAVLLLKHLFQAFKTFDTTNKVILEWILKQLKSKQNTLKMKNRILDILPHLLKFKESEFQEKLKEALKMLVETNFPLSSSELAKGDSCYSDYCTTFDHLCRGLKETGSIVVLEQIIPVVAREESHSCLELIQASLKGLIENERLTNEAKLELIECPFKKFSNCTELSPQIRLRALTHFLLPMIDGILNVRILESFFCDTMAFIISSFLLSTAGGTETERLNRFSVKTGCFKLVAKLYGNAPSKDLVHSETSSVTKKAFDILKDKGEIPSSSKYTGKELSIFLVKKLQSFRADVIDGSNSLKEAFRILHCEAFNSLMTIIAKLQNQEKFFTMVFKEESSKSEYIWSRIVDCSLNLHFPLELDSVNERRTKFIAIRKSNKSKSKENTSNGSIGHFLDDSSLSQDVTSFDFHGSYTSFGKSGSKKDSAENNDQIIASSNEVILEGDHLNDHECMAHLVRLIQYMQDEEIYNASDTGKLPGWMEQIRNKLQDESTHQNIKLFLLRLILNCADSFKPFAKYFGKDILHVVTNCTTWKSDNIVNYFSLDLIVMLLSWSENWIPEGSLSERNSASILLEKISVSADHPRREIIRYLLHVIGYMVEVWKPALTISYSIIHKLFSRYNTNSTTLNATSLTGIQLEIIVLKNGFPPWRDNGNLTEEKFFVDLASNLKSSQKVIYKSAAEVLGMVLNFFKRDTLPPESKFGYADILRIVESKMNEISDTPNLDYKSDNESHCKFFDCLFNIYKAHPKIVSHFASGFVYNLRQSTFKGESLAQGLEMLQGATEYLKSNVIEGSNWSKELSSIDLDYFLDGRIENFQFQALCFFLSVLPELQEQRSSETICHYLKIISKFSEHPSSKCRQKAVEIVFWVYDAFRPDDRLNHVNEDTGKKIFELCSHFLAKGLGDDDPSIVSQICTFFCSNSRLNDKNTLKRIQEIFSSLLLPDQKSFLFIFPDLLLSMIEKSPDFQTKLFENPLDECEFNEYAIDTNWRTQHSSAPQWVQTLSTLSSQSQDEVPKNFLRATQISLTFAPTLQVHEQLIGLDTFSGAAGEFKLNDEKSLMKNQTEVLTRDGLLRVGKRFVKTSTDETYLVSQESHERTKTHFAKQHQRNKTRLEEIEKERKGRRRAQVNLMRKYRIGELPDIQISYSDVIRPLKNLCFFDEQFSRNLIVELITSLTSTASSETLKTLRRSLIHILNSYELSDRILVATLLEALVPLLEADLSADEEILSTEKLVSICRMHDLEPLGILTLETLIPSRAETSFLEVPKKRPRLELRVNKFGLKPSPSDVFCLIKLYKSKGDLQSARELFQQDVASNTDASMALSLETMAKYEDAKKQYETLIRTSSSQQDAKMWKEGYINCLNNLSEWEMLSSFTQSELGADPVRSIIEDDWMDSVILPNFIKSKLHMISEKNPNRSSDTRFLFETIDGIRKSGAALKKSFEKRFGLPLALLYFHKSMQTDVEFWVNRCLQEYLSDWTKRNEFSTVSYIDLLSSLRRLVQLRNFLTKPDCFNLFGRRQIDPKESLLNYAEFLNDASLCLPVLNVENSSELGFQILEVDGFLQLANESLKRNLFFLSIKTLAKVRNLMESISDDERKASLSKKFNLTYFNASALKCEVDKSLPPEKRLNILYGFLLKVRAQNLNDPEIIARMLQVCSKLIQVIKTRDGSPDQVEEIATVTFPDEKDLMKADHFKNLVEGLNTRDQVRYRFEYDALEILSEIPHNEWTDEKKFYQTTLFYDLWNHFPTERSLDLACSLVESHMGALKLGSQRAMKMFPNLLSFLEDISSSGEYSRVLNIFRVESQFVQPWMFIPWINQILAIFSSCSEENFGSVLGALALRVAEKYPEAIRFPFRFTLEQMKSANQDYESLPFVGQIKHQLSGSALLEQIICSMSDLCSPEVKLKDMLFELKRNMRESDGSIRSEQVLKLIKKFKSDIERNSIETIGGKIHTDYSKKFSSELRDLFGLTAETLESNLEGILLRLFNHVNSKKSSKETNLLKEYSSFLHSFNMGNHDESVELFGQYGGYGEPDPKRHTKVSSFKEKVEIFSSLRKPMKITVIGDDGKSYPWIVKYGEDLRQDQRIQQAFGVANDILSDREERLLPIRTYKVVPFSTRLGLIEFLADTTTYKDLCQPNDKRLPPVVIDNAAAFLKSLRGQKIGSDFLHFISKDLGGCQDLKKSFHILSASLEGFFFLRENFLKSHGTSSIVSWIMSIGDRHADNLLISKRSGESIPIDFGHAFGSTCFLSLPELVPFRLTPEIQSLMWPFHCSGPLRVAMIQTLKAMVERKDVLLSALSVFIKEPTLDWLKLAKENAKRENLSQTRNQINYPAKKLKIVEEKLSLVHPCRTLMEELRHGWSGTPHQMRDVQSLVWGPDGCKRRALSNLCPEERDTLDEDTESMEIDDNIDKETPSGDLSVENQVDTLLDLATDHEILSRAYMGWKAWL